MKSGTPFETVDKNRLCFSIHKYKLNMQDLINCITLDLKLAETTGFMTQTEQS